MIPVELKIKIGADTMDQMKRIHDELKQELEELEKLDKTKQKQETNENLFCVRNESKSEKHGNTMSDSNTDWSKEDPWL